MSARTLAMLKLSIVVMTVLIAAGVIALVIGLKRKAETLAPAGDAVLQLPAGAKITALSSDEMACGFLLKIKRVSNRFVVLMRRQQRLQLLPFSQTSRLTKTVTLY